MAIIVFCMLTVTLASVLTKWFLMPLLGIEWPFRRVSVPWRFSLLSIIVLIAVTAVVLALFRDAPDVSIVSLVIVIVVWLTIVRYIAFRRSVSDQSHRTLSTMLSEKEREVER